MSQKILILAGPTAVGKTSYSIDLAKALNGEIISCDSMQLYKYLNIGSAKPTETELSLVPHHLIGEFDPSEPFSVAIYAAKAKKAITDISSRGKLPIITGGTGLYLNSILYHMDFGTSEKNYEYRKNLEKIASEKGSIFVHNMLKEKDEDGAKRIHPNNLRRVIRALESIELSGVKLESFDNVKNRNENYDPIEICLTRDRDELYDRINMRVKELIDEGLLDEVEGLMAMGLDGDHISMKGIGYKEIIGHINGEYDLPTAIELIQKNTRHYAKRQITWFKRYKEMKLFNLSEYNNKETALKDIEKWARKRL